MAGRRFKSIFRRGSFSIFTRPRTESNRGTSSSTNGFASRPETPTVSTARLENERENESDLSRFANLRLEPVARHRVNSAGM